MRTLGDLIGWLNEEGRNGLFYIWPMNFVVDNFGRFVSTKNGIC